jgi:hypothetical protein
MELELATHKRKKKKAAKLRNLVPCKDSRL